MARDRQCVRLEDGLRLSLPKLLRDGTMRRGESLRLCRLRWAWTYTSEKVAAVVLTGSLSGRSPALGEEDRLWLTIRNAM